MVQATQTKNLPANIEEEMAKRAQAVAQSEPSQKSGQFLSTQGGQFALGSDKIGTELNVVVVGWCHERQWYKDRYTPGSKAVPGCYAFDTEGEPASPHEKCSDRQSETCAGCPHNEWESDPYSMSGKGKWCKEVRRLALIDAGALKDGVSDADVVWLKVPVTSTYGWTDHVHKVAAAVKRPPYGVVTTIRLEPSKSGGFGMTFEVPTNGVIDRDLLGELMAKHDEVQGRIAFPYPDPVEEEKPAANTRLVRKGLRK